jgi:outer membrane immunogenic protein
MKLKLLLAAAAVFAAVPAQAQDTETGNATFTGPRIQAQVGWNRTGINIFDTRNFGGRGNFGAGSEQDNEISYGGEAGFDFDLGGLVVGAYVGGEFSNNSEGFNFTTATATVPATPRLLLEMDRNLYAGGRVGVVAGGRALIYAKGGLSRTTLEESNPAGTARTVNFPTGDQDLDGIHFGGGVEVALSEMFYVRADYTHTRYDDMALPVQTNPAETFELHANRNVVNFAVGVRF